MDQIDKTMCNIFNLVPTLTDIFFKAFEKKNISSTLSNSHIKTLMFLRIEGSKTMTQISQKVELEKGSFTPVANHLIHLGYIEKVKSSEDKRICMLSLTVEGYALTSKILDKHKIHIEQQLDKLSKEEKTAFISSIALVLSLAHKMQD